MTCAALTTADTMWSFCPSIGASALFIAIFALVTAAHLAQAVHLRAPYCWVLIMSAVWQLLTYIFRTASIRAPASFGLYAAWFVLILVAPLWTNAFAYMVFGRLVWQHTSQQRVWGLRATRFGACFVVLDIVAFVVQVCGAAQATSNNAAADVILRGLHLYMAGVGVQLLFLLICAAFGLKLWTMLWAAPERNVPVLRLMAVQFAVLVLIVIRILFRIVEYSSGLTSTVPSHEAFQYCLDTLPMLLALLLYTAVHPGHVLRGEKMPSMWSRRGRPSDVHLSGEELR